MFGQSNVPIPGLTAEMAARIPRHPEEGKALLSYAAMTVLVWVPGVVAIILLILVPLNVLSSALMWPSLAVGVAMFAGAGLTAKRRAYWYHQPHFAMIVEPRVAHDAYNRSLYGFRVAGYNRAGQLHQGLVNVHWDEFEANDAGDVIPVANRLIWP